MPRQPCEWVLSRASNKSTSPLMVSLSSELQITHTDHVITDSIGTGEDGPTHQPIALAALYRAMPNVLYMRPCDSEEVAGAFEVAIKATETPSIISLSRQVLPQWVQSSREGFAKGAYVFVEEEDFDVTLISTGSEMVFAMQTRDLLEEKYNITARVVSFPVPRLFEQQSREYKQSTLKPKSGKPAVVIEAYAANGWERYCDAAFSMRRFGKSLPSKDAYKYFGFEPEVMAPKIRELVEEVKRDGIEVLRGDFRDLNGALGVGFEH